MISLPPRKPENQQPRKSKKTVLTTPEREAIAKELGLLLGRWRQLSGLAPKKANQLLPKSGALFGRLVAYVDGSQTLSDRDLLDLLYDLRRVYIELTRQVIGGGAE